MKCLQELLQGSMKPFFIFHSDNQFNALSRLGDFQIL